MARRILRILGNVFSIVLLVLVLAAVAMAVAQKRSQNGVASIFGHPLLTVLSGSMTPTFRTGDVIVDRSLTPAQAANLHRGQVITFATGSLYHGKPMLITHRIIGVMKITNQATHHAQRLYVTKGDANNAPDAALVNPKQVQGVYAWRIPMAGYFANFVHKPIGFGIFIGLPALYLIGGEFVRIWRLIDEEERRKRSLSLPEGTETPR